MASLNLFIEDNNDDGKGNRQSLECFIKGSFDSLNINCDIEISIFAKDKDEMLQNKLSVIEKLTTDLEIYKKVLLENE